MIPLSMDAGDTIYDITTNVVGDGSARFLRTMVKEGQGGTPQTLLFSALSPTCSVGWQALSFGAMNQVIQTGESYVLGFQGLSVATQAGIGVTSVTYCSTRP